MMPFQSQAQMRAAFGGHLGPEMKAKAKSWAEETPDPKHLPRHKRSRKGHEWADRIARGKK